MSIEEYADLAGTGFQGGRGEAPSPEDDFFHSVYVAAKTRSNHINVTEQSGKFQIRGVQYNLDEVNMIIVHTKDILANIKSEKGKKETVECFSYKDGEPPWFGTSVLPNGNRRQCPQTSAERAVNDFCNPCRSQIIVAGIYCKADGTPILDDNNKPIFIFIRGKGMRYANVSNYLNDLYTEENLSPLFQPQTEQTKQFEKSVVNNKRFVTKITKGEETSGYGSTVNVFVLNRGIQIPNENVMSILKLSKQTLSKFNDKFDWSKKKAVSNYGQSTPEGVLSVDSKTPESKTDEAPSSQEQQPKVFNFEDINF